MATPTNTNTPWPYTGSTVSASANVSPSSQVSSRGFVYSTSVQVPTVNGAGQPAAGCVRPFFEVVPGAGSPTAFAHVIGSGVAGAPDAPLQQGQLIYVRAYAISADGTNTVTYSPVLQVTPSTTPTLHNDANVTSITGTSARFGGVLDDNGGAAILERGILVSRVGAGFTNDYNNHEFKFSTLGNIAVGTHFLFDASGLTAGVTYNVRAFCRNKNNVAPAALAAYGGASKQFTTIIVGPPTLTTVASSPSPRTVNATGDVTANGNSAISQTGFVYSETDTTPTIGEAGVTRIIQPDLADPFSTSITGLSSGLNFEGFGGKTYYVRSYAQNAAGFTGYGPTVAVVTPVDLAGLVAADATPGLKGDVEVDNEFGQLVDLVGNCSVPVESPKFTVEDSRIRVEQDADFTCTHPSQLFDGAGLRLADVMTEVDLPQSFLSSDAIALVVAHVNARLSRARSGFEVGLSELSIDPLGYVHDTIVPNDSIVRHFAPQFNPHPPPSNDITPPHALGGTATPSSVTLTWVNSPDSDVVLQRVYQATGPGVWVPVADVNVPAHSTTVHGLDDATPYFFRVTAVDAGDDESDPTGVLLIKTGTNNPPPPPPNQPPAQVTNFFVDPSTQSAAMTWDANGEKDLKGYHIAQLVGSQWQVKKTVLKPAHATTLSGLTPDTAYQFRVTAFDTGGLDGKPSKVSHVVTDSVGPPPPGSVLPLGLGLQEFDPTGKRDESDKLVAWANTRGDGTGAHGLKRLRCPRVFNGNPVKLRLEGGVNGGISFHAERHDIVFDFGGTAAQRGNDGAQLVQTTKKPFVVRADGSEWAVWYTPTNTKKRTFPTQLAANGNAATLNRTRDMFRLQGCTRVWLMRGNANGQNASTVYESEVEAQDFITFEGSRDCALTDFTVTHFYGNGFETVRQDGNGSAPIGVWVDNCTFDHFGRQTCSLTVGGHFIIENTKLAGAVRSLIDAEPVSSYIEPGLTAMVDGIYLLDIDVGHHGLGMLAIHAGVSKLLLSGAKGREMNSSGVILADHVIIEDVVETQTNIVDGYAFQFGIDHANSDTNNVGEDWGGHHIIVRRVKKEVHNGTVHCPFDVSAITFLRVVQNVNGGHPQVADDSGVSEPPIRPAGYTGFSLPIPAHALRDLA